MEMWDGDACANSHTHIHEIKILNSTHYRRNDQTIWQSTVLIYQCQYLLMEPTNWPPPLSSDQERVADI